MKAQSSLTHAGRWLLNRRDFLRLGGTGLGGIAPGLGARGRRRSRPAAAIVAPLGPPVGSDGCNACRRRATSAAPIATGEIELGARNVCHLRERDLLADQLLDRGDRLAVFRRRQG